MAHSCLSFGRSFLFVLPLVFFFSETRFLTAETVEAPRPVVAGYYPCWPSPLPIEKIDFKLFTHLIHAFATLKDGKVVIHDNLPSKELTRAAHGAGVKVLLGLGGADTGAQFADMTRDPATRQACVQSLARMVADYGYDGIDVDWECPGIPDRENVVLLIDELRQALQATNPHALVTMPLPPTDWSGRYFDGPALAKRIDLAFIMTYEAHGTWKEDGKYCHAGFNSPLNPTESDPVDGARFTYQKGIGYWRERGFKDSQLVAGIPLFGHGFMVKKWGDTPLVLAPHPDIEYAKIQALLDAGWVRHWDAQAGVPWLQSPAGVPQQLVTYDDPQSVELKGKWAHEAGLRGIFFWEISQDFTGGKHPLIEASRKGFGLAGEGQR